MLSFNEKELEELGVILPNYSRSLCIKALDLAKKNLGNGTKDQFISYMVAFCDLLKTEEGLSKETKDKVEGSIGVPFSQLFQEPAKADELLDTLDTIIPQNHPIRAMNAHESNESSPKPFFAASIFALILMLSVAEKKLRRDGVAGDELMRRLDVWSEQVRMMYEQLLYFDSEVENVKNRYSKRVAANKSNAGHTELHRQFFDFFAEYGETWSKAECARRFYRSLNGESQRRYTSERHAERQLTEALRKYLAN